MTKNVKRKHLPLILGIETSLVLLLAVFVLPNHTLSTDSFIAILAAGGIVMAVSSAILNTGQAYLKYTAIFTVALVAIGLMFGNNVKEPTAKNTAQATAMSSMNAESVQQSERISENNHEQQTKPYDKRGIIDNIVLATRYGKELYYISYEGTTRPTIADPEKFDNLDELEIGDEFVGKTNANGILLEY